jgi:predicted SnoaL-like aldol condensation-catalyzing enzyme
MLKKKTISGILIITLLTIGLNVSFASNIPPKNNKEIATEFLQSIVNAKDFNAASKYLGTWYTEHDPDGTDGPVGLKAYIQFLQDNFPNSHIEIKRIIADGDYVIFHVHSVLTPGTRGQAIVDIFRLDKGKVIEHWDVTQEIPEKSSNPNGMF